MHTFWEAPPPKTNVHKMFNEKNIESALADINAELIPNVSVIARKWEVDCTTLTKQFLGQTTARAPYLSK